MEGNPPSDHFSDEYITIPGRVRRAQRIKLLANVLLFMIDMGSLSLGFIVGYQARIFLPLFPTIMQLVRLV